MVMAADTNLLAVGLNEAAAVEAGIARPVRLLVPLVIVTGTVVAARRPERPAPAVAVATGTCSPLSARCANTAPAVPGAVLEVRRDAAAVEPLRFRELRTAPYATKSAVGPAFRFLECVGTLLMAGMLLVCAGWRRCNGVSPVGKPPPPSRTIPSIIWTPAVACWHSALSAPDSARC